MCMCTMAIKYIIEVYKIKGYLQKALYDKEVGRKYLYVMLISLNWRNSALDLVDNTVLYSMYTAKH